MALSVIDPPAGAPMGYGQAFLAHSSTPLVGRETLSAILRWMDPGGSPRIMCTGSGELSAGSGNAKITLGLTYLGEFSDVGAPDARGAMAGAALDLVLIRNQYGGPVLESADLGTYFTHDPDSQAPRLMWQLLSFFHDPMLDEILAAVKHTFAPTI